MASEGKSKEMAIQTAQIVFSKKNWRWPILEEKKKGQFTVEKRKKKREIIEENHHQVDIPADVGDQEKEALQHTGEDATAGW